MIRSVKQTAVMILALAMTVAPALGCCAGFLDHGLAPPAHKAVSAAAGDHSPLAPAATAEHCPDHGPAARQPDDHSGGLDDPGCGGCITCSGVDMAMQDVTLSPKAAAGQSGGAIAMPAAAPRSLASPVRHILPPPQGPPVSLRTPVQLKTMLRL